MRNSELYFTNATAVVIVVKNNDVLYYRGECIFVLDNFDASRGSNATQGVTLSHDAADACNANAN